MRDALLSRRLPALALAMGCVATSAPALGQVAPQVPDQAPPQATMQGPLDSDNNRTVTFADIKASVGFSENPNLQSGQRSSAFGRVSVTAYRAWRGDRGSTSLSGFVENTTYVRGGYGSKQIFRVNARTNRALSEKVRVFGSLAASGDISGQLTNRFTGPVLPPPPDGGPPPDTNPDVINLIGRQYLVNGQAGISVTTSARSAVSLSASAAHAFFTGGSKIADYTTYESSFGYSHQLSERTSVGASVSLQRQDLSAISYSNVVNAAVTLSTKLAEDISANGSIGILAISSHRFGQSDQSYSPSFSASICKLGERTQYCAAVSRTAATPLSTGTAPIARSAAVTTNFDLSYNREIGRTGTLRAIVTATSSSRVSVVNEGRFRITYVTGLVSYDRNVADRLYAGVSVGTRSVFQTGPDPRRDFNGNFFLRYRLGDRL